MENEIKNELLELGFNVDSKGIIYWIEAIRYVENNPLWENIIDIYEMLSIKYENSVQNIERDMRTAIQPAKENIQKNYNYYKMIKNQTFLNLIRFKLI